METKLRMSNYFVRILIVAICLVLQACSSAPKKTTRTVTSEPVLPSTQIQQQTSLELLQAVNPENETNEVLNGLLDVVESEARQNCNTAIQLIDILQKASLNTTQENRKNWYLAGCLAQGKEYATVITLLSQLKIAPQWREQYDQLLYDAFLATKKWKLAAEALYRLPGEELEKAQQIWNLLENLTNEELIAARQEISNLTPYLNLLEIQRNFVSPQELRMGINQWQSMHQGHPFAVALPTSLANIVSLVPDNPMNIGVILPLSGRYKEQGEATKQGILMATMATGFSSDHKMTFFDSNDEQELVSENMADLQLVIGPLLRENIDIVGQLIPAGVPLLSLNRNETAENSGNSENSENSENTKKNIFYLSLAPEDEAQQIANYLQHIGKTSPLVIASLSGSYQRMSDAFSQTWDEVSELPAEILSFDNTSDLRKAIAEALDIEESKSRINQIKAMTNVEVHAMERNRRDIDAIVIFASAAQTILINPIIESSISPFAEIIPVYASSRSFSQRLNKNGLRDLRNLQFIEMPWMLPSREFNYLQNKSKELWPNRSDSHNRLFALGYDAVNLIPRIRYLSELKNQTFAGMTGTLVLNERNESVRTLRWASIEEEQVSVALD